ncbi:MAG: winged helix-turn-helix transcriptional regulator [Eubacteriales bacterium]|nr:winged helix-turn-helix transcriptional regulator [Eubacteriales bacterium]
MNDELDILQIIAKNPSISQRKIAAQTGISLGQVNFLIKKCVKKGLIKIEGQTAKSIKYNLTPKGLAEKASLTKEYIKISYGAVIRVTDRIRSIVKQYESLRKKIYVYGPEDEMMEICKIALGDNAEYISMPSERDMIQADSVCLYWERSELENNISWKDENIIWVNILN